MKLSFVVPGEPIAKARPRLGFGGRTFTPQRTLDHEARLSEAGKVALREARADDPNDPEAKLWPRGADYKLTMRFYMPTKRYPDLDNLVKSVDGLNGVVWYDDVQVTQLAAERHYDKSSPRTEIEIEVVEYDGKTSEKRRLAHEAKLANRAARKRAPKKSSSGRKKHFPRRRRPA